MHEAVAKTNKTESRSDLTVELTQELCLGS